MKLTETQTAVLTYIAAHPDCDLQQMIDKLKNESLARETVQFLKLNDLISRTAGWSRLELTEDGHRRAESARIGLRRHSHCPSCAAVHCVCEIRTVCLGDGPHSLGCHGSHE